MAEEYYGYLVVSLKPDRCYLLAAEMEAHELASTLAEKGPTWFIDLGGGKLERYHGSVEA